MMSSADSGHADGGVAARRARAGGAPAPRFELFGIHLWGAREDRGPRSRSSTRCPTRSTLTVTGGDDGLEASLENASALWTDRETPASGTGGLLSKARGDYRRILAALYADGYYGPTISIRAAGAGGRRPDARASSSRRTCRSSSTSTPGRVPVRRDRASSTRRRRRPTSDDAGRDLRPRSASRPASRRAPASINQASALSIERWRQLSCAKAREADREVIADHPTEPARRAR